MGITFAYELGWKSFLYEKSSTRKVTSEFNAGNPVKHFQNPQKPNRKKVTGLLRSRVEKIEKYIEFLKENEEFETEFLKLGDGISISKRHEQK